jgi:hypothetical protein
VDRVQGSQVQGLGIVLPTLVERPTWKMLYNPNTHFSISFQEALSKITIISLQLLKWSLFMKTLEFNEIIQDLMEFVFVLSQA